MPAPDWAQKILCIIVPSRRTVSPEVFSWVCTRRLLRSFSIDDGDGNEKVTFKMNSCFFKLCRVYSNSLKMWNVKFTEMWNVKWNFLGVDFLGTGLKLRKRKENSSSLVTFSINREIRHFHVVAVQWRQRNVQKSAMRVQSCCFANHTCCFFAVLVAVAVVVAKASCYQRLFGSCTKEMHAVRRLSVWAV